MSDRPPGRAYSVSQVKTYRQCGLLWYLDRIWFEAKAGDTAKQARGRALHTEFQSWGESSSAPTDPRLRMLTDDQDVKDMVGPGTGCEYEAEVRRNLAPWGIGTDEDPVYFWGFVDAWRPGLVFDLKTTSSIAKWAKREHELVYDTQMLTYARLLDPEHTAPWTLVHGYVQTEGAPDIDLVTVRVSPAEIEAEWQRTLATIKEMEELRHKAKVPRDVPIDHDKGTGDPCRAFGGCHRRDLCRSGEVDTLVQLPTATPCTLYIDCRPIKGQDVVLFEDLCKPVADEFEAMAGVPWSSKKYREGSGPMARAFERMPLPPVVYLSSAHPLYAEARAALVPRCDTVVEGLR